LVLWASWLLVPFFSFSFCTSSVPVMIMAFMGGHCWI
jgi:hypothetical protein